MDLLVLSNGYGEDAIAAHLVGRLVQRRPSLEVGAVPLVGSGHAYDRAGVPVLFRSWPMPSGGFGWQSPRLFWKDLAAGFLSLTAAQLDALRRLRERVRGLLLVGDIYPVLLSAAYRVPRVFVATARSDYIGPHLALERRLLARLCDVVFARDARTAGSLCRHGVAAVHVGNVMMDLLQPRGFSLGLAPDRPVLALLPGSRQDFADNLVALAEVAAEVVAQRPQVQAVAAVAPGSLPLRLPPGCSWRVVEPDGQGRADGLECVLEGPSGPRIAVTSQGFADLLRRATVVLGLSGTANEQAAGLGVPVVAFPREGVQYTRRFALRQKRLLGEALVLVEDAREAAVWVRQLLEDPAERERRGQAGRQRMGEPGATERIVAWMERVFGWCPTCASARELAGPVGPES